MLVKKMKEQAAQMDGQKRKSKVGYVPIEQVKKSGLL